uniref:Uncharacterized protein n=1 Tax=Rhizophora mucronata TaxID=61149 RepID=A0A2P2QY47_RHIMU
MSFSAMILESSLKLKVSSLSLSQHQFNPKQKEKKILLSKNTKQ